MLNDKEENCCFTLFSKNAINLNNKGNTVRMYRIIITDSTSHQHDNSNGSQVLLLHGTKATNVKGILKTGSFTRGKLWSWLLTVLNMQSCTVKSLVEESSVSVTLL